MQYSYNLTFKDVWIVLHGMCLVGGYFAVPKRVVVRAVYNFRGFHIFLRMVVDRIIAGLLV